MVKGGLFLLLGYFKFCRMSASSKLFFCHIERPLLSQTFCHGDFINYLCSFCLMTSHRAQQWLPEIHMFCMNPFTSKPLHIQEHSSQQISGHKCPCFWDPLCIHFIPYVHILFKKFEMFAETFRMASPLIWSVHSGTQQGHYISNSSLIINSSYSILKYVL